MAAEPEEWVTALLRHARAFRQARAAQDGLAAHRAFTGVLAALEGPATPVVESTQSQARRPAEAARSGAPPLTPGRPTDQRNEGG